KPFGDGGYLAGLAAEMTAKLRRRVLFQSFDFAILHALRRVAAEVPRGALFEHTKESFVAIAQRAQADFAAPDHHLVTQAQVESAHEAGIAVIPWTTNHPLEWKRLIAAGVDGLITDDPAALLQYLGRG